MKASELRINNWYKSVKFGVPVMCELTDLSELDYRSDGAYTNPPIDEMFEPIPLTEEWLLKFNAVCQPWGWVINGIIIRWSILKKQGKYWIELGNGKRIELPFVHTLQNFFILTGNELK